MKTKPQILKTGFIILLLSCVLQVGAQKSKSDCCDNPGRASIQIPNAVYNERVCEFLKSETLATLRRNRGGEHPLSAGTLSLTVFFNFLKSAPTGATGVKIYFAAHNQSGAQYNELVPIFAFTNNVQGNDQVDIKNAYYIYNPQQNGFISIDFEDAKKLHQHFTKNLQMHAKETHTLWFRKDKLDEWMDDICCQQRGITGNTIEKIIFDWAVYEKDIKDPITNVDLTTKGRLTLLFMIPNAAEMKKKNILNGGYDTAVPCPPGQNCNDGLDG